jgi:hypothetical protein
MYPHRHTPSDGVLEIPYQDFPGTYQRTNTVPAECPNAAIVWVNSIDQLVQAGTSWYELVRAGTYQKSVILHCLPIQIGWYAGTLVRYQTVPRCSRPTPSTCLAQQEKTTGREVEIATRSI